MRTRAEGLASLLFVLVVVGLLTFTFIVSYNRSLKNDRARYDRALELCIKSRGGEDDRTAVYDCQYKLLIEWGDRP
jgi:hypothetical protein